MYERPGNTSQEGKQKNTKNIELSFA